MNLCPKSQQDGLKSYVDKSETVADLHRILSYVPLHKVKDFIRDQLSQESQLHLNKIYYGCINIEHTLPKELITYVFTFLPTLERIVLCRLSKLIYSNTVYPINGYSNKLDYSSQYQIWTSFDVSDNRAICIKNMQFLYPKMYPIYTKINPNNTNVMLYAFLKHKLQSYLKSIKLGSACMIILKQLMGHEIHAIKHKKTVSIDNSSNKTQFTNNRHSNNNNNKNNNNNSNSSNNNNNKNKRNNRHKKNDNGNGNGWGTPSATSNTNGSGNLNDRYDEEMNDNNNNRLISTPGIEDDDNITPFGATMEFEMSGMSTEDTLNEESLSSMSNPNKRRRKCRKSQIRRKVLTESPMSESNNFSQKKNVYRVEFGSNSLDIKSNNNQFKEKTMSHSS